jgi:DNA adenine methylase
MTNHTCIIERGECLACDKEACDRLRRRIADLEALIAVFIRKGRYHMQQVPHPIPYQGSKRSLAPRILDVVYGRPVCRLYEPFAGSAAITIAAARAHLAQSFLIADSLAPLVEIWRSVLTNPLLLADDYQRIWSGQSENDHGYYTRIREAYNREPTPAALLYLLARCVKNSPRWNQEGLFNQSADKRRLGMRPNKMRREIMGAHHLLRGKTEVVACDFEQTLAEAGPRDLVYMDPPWQGTSGGRDTRYHQGLSRERLLAALETLNRRGVPWLLSYDGRCGAKTYGVPLPRELKATQIELDAGRSSQATLNGVAAVTMESLYVSAVARRQRDGAHAGEARAVVGEVGGKP